MKLIITRSIDSIRSDSNSVNSNPIQWGRLYEWRWSDSATCSLKTPSCVAVSYREKPFLTSDS